MNDVSNTLFWVSFVGVAIFIVSAVHATIVLRLAKTKEFKPPDLALTAVSLCMAIIFIAISVSHRVTHPDIPKETPLVIPPKESYKKTGIRFEYDSTKKKIDTIDIFEKVR